MTLSETREHITHHGEMMAEAGQRHLADGNVEQAKRCLQRSEAAGEGKLLWGDEEARDPVHSMGHQKLYVAASEHGLVVHDFREPSEV
jgi:hypothetical protein